MLYSVIDEASSWRTVGVMSEQFCATWYLQVTFSRIYHCDRYAHIYITMLWFVYLIHICILWQVSACTHPEANRDYISTMVLASANCDYKFPIRHDLLRTRVYVWYVRYYYMMPLPVRTRQVLVASSFSAAAYYYGHQFRHLFIFQLQR